MTGIDQLEHGGAQRRGFLAMHDGEVLALPDPRSLHFQGVLRLLGSEHLPGTDALPLWKHDLLFERWRLAWGLPTFADARRLTYLVDNYRAAITADLAHHAPGIDLGERWRERDWTTLLDIIDRLPGHSWYATAVANDEEHSKMMAASIAERNRDSDAEEDKGPPLNTWTPEVAMLTQLIDAVNQVNWSVIAVQAGDKAPAQPKPMPRPVTALQKAMRNAEFNRKKARHEALAARVLRRSPTS